MERKIDVIIVDDNIACLDILEYILNKKGHFNILARFSSGLELLEYPDLIKAKLILMDIEMPEMHGIAIARVVNFMYSHIKLIAISMYRERVSLEQLITAGYKGFVNKNDLVERLFPVIDRVMKDKLSFPGELKI